MESRLLLNLGGIIVFYNSALKVLNRVQNHKVCIVGAGNNGRELYKFLHLSGVEITSFFDNDEYLIGKSLYKVSIKQPIKLEASVMYVVSVAENYRKDIIMQLNSIGIDADSIIIYYPYRDYEYMSSLGVDEYQQEIEELFRERIGYDMDFRNPQTYNEILNWEKINLKSEIRSKLSDKYMVREWVKDRIDEVYLLKLYDTWVDANKIDFDLLPNKYALKVNNGSGRNIIVDDKSKTNVASMRAKLTKWMKDDFSLQTIELHYRDIVPRIICEEWIDTKSEGFYDVKFYCFHGEPKYIQCIRDEHEDSMRAGMYDLNWNRMPFNHGYPDDETDAPRPVCLERMIDLTCKLCKDFTHVRVDWFLLPEGDIKFGEMSFSSWSGLKRFSPKEYDYEFGRLIRGE